MSRRNLAWILGVLLLGLLVWLTPDTIHRHRSFYRVFSPLADICAQIQKNYVEEVDDQVLLEGAIQGMLRGLDPYCRWIPPDQQEAFDQQTNGIIHGIGVVLNKRSGVLTVVSSLEDSPAFKAGIMPGDRILKIDGESTGKMTVAQAAKLISGKPGTKVTIEVRHELTDKVETLVVERDVVERHSVKGFVRARDGDWDYLADKEYGIAYVRILGFMNNTAEQLDQAYMRMRSSLSAGLVLDLRNNPGGTLQSAVDVSNRFLDEGLIVATRGRHAKETVCNASHENTYPAMPVVVLVNQYTASAAEIVAGALKDHGRAVVVGERTFGKGSVQELIPLEGYGEIKLTTAHYYLKSGRNIHRRPGATEWGVDPDVKIKLTADELIAIRQSQIQADSPFVVPSTTRPDRTASESSASTSLIVDRQLAKALEILRTKYDQSQRALQTRRSVVGAGR